LTKRADLIGYRIGRLEVIAPAPTRNGRSYWKARCSCEAGTVVEVSAGNLIPRIGREATRSCGCLKRETHCAGKDWNESARRRLLSLYRGHAIGRGYVWELHDDDFFALTAACCVYCGAMPGRAAHEERKRGKHLFNGVDRKDNTQGYVVGNVVACCTKCNMAKRKQSHAQFIALIVILAFWFGPPTAVKFGPPGRHWLGFMDGAREA